MPPPTTASPDATSVLSRVSLLPLTRMFPPRASGESNEVTSPPLTRMSARVDLGRRTTTSNTRSSPFWNTVVSCGPLPWIVSGPLAAMSKSPIDVEVLVRRGDDRVLLRLQLDRVEAVLALCAARDRLILVRGLDRLAERAVTVVVELVVGDVDADRRRVRPGGEPQPARDQRRDGDGSSRPHDSLTVTVECGRSLASWLVYRWGDGSGTSSPGAIEQRGVSPPRGAGAARGGRRADRSARSCSGTS